MRMSVKSESGVLFGRKQTDKSRILKRLVSGVLYNWLKFYVI